MREIEIDWKYPRDYCNIDEHPFADCLGLYYISRIWGGKETVIYVGETLQAFKERIKQHNRCSDKYTQTRGKLIVRLGTIPNSFNFGNMNKKHFMMTLESAIIQNIKDKEGVRLFNNRQVKKYTYHYDLDIHNTGYRGKIDEILLTEKYTE